MQTTAEETEAMRRTQLLGLEERRETKLHHERRQERDDEREHRINPDADHADLVGENVAAFLGRGRDGQGALAEEQAAHDFHRGRDAMHLRVANGRLAHLVVAVRLLAAGIQFRAHRLNRALGLERVLLFLRRRGEGLINLRRLRRAGFHEQGQAGQQFLTLAIRLLALAAGTTVEILAQLARIRVHLRHALAALVAHCHQLRFLGFDLRFEFRNQRRLENLVHLALRRHAGVHGFFHDLAAEKIRGLVLGQVFFVGRLRVRVIGQLGLVGILDARFLGVPSGGAGQLDFTARAQLGDGFGELLGIGGELLDEFRLPDFHFG